MTGTELSEELAAFYEGRGDGAALLAALRGALLALPVVDGDSPVIVQSGGLSWLFAFTVPAELARFAAARGEGEIPCPFVTIRGVRLLDGLMPAMAQATGVALDVAGVRPMLFPPLRGVVPDAAALDGTRG